MASDSLGKDLIIAAAGADLSTRLYHAVVPNTDTPGIGFDVEVALAGAGVRPIGFLNDADVENKGVTVNLGPKQIAVAGAAITQGALLVCGANGRLLVSTSGTSGDAIIGYAASPASGDGARFNVIFGNFGTV